MPPTEDLRFPPDFRWGTATSAHQVEGNNIHNDWWVWEQQPGRIKNGDRSGRACDWWAHAERDFDLAAQFHQNAHRLSIEWSRIQPAPDRWDDYAIDRYRQMLRALRERGIEPMATLLHFTVPRWFAERGGWERDDAVAIFVRFVERAVPALAEFVPIWCTVNEPLAWVAGSYVTGTRPPGRRSIRRALVVATHLARAHAAAYRVVHRAQPHALVGVANYFRLYDPANPRSPLDRLVASGQDRFLNWAFIDAVTTGRARAFPWVASIPEAAGTLDFLGVNYYTRDRVAFDLRIPLRLFGRNFHAPDALMSDGGYGEIYPEGLYRVLLQAQRYGVPLYVTENGLPDADDDQRPRFLVAHLYQLWKAMQEGVRVNGYYHWSLIDNFEWADGWTLKFGLIEVDPTTQARKPRPSAGVFAEICTAGAITRAMRERHITLDGGRGT